MPYLQLSSARLSKNIGVQILTVVLDEIEFKSYRKRRSLSVRLIKILYELSLDRIYLSLAMFCSYGCPLLARRTWHSTSYTWHARK